MKFSKREKTKLTNPDRCDSIYDAAKRAFSNRADSLGLLPQPSSPLIGKSVKHCNNTGRLFIDESDQSPRVAVVIANDVLEGTATLYSIQSRDMLVMDINDIELREESDRNFIALFRGFVGAPNTPATREELNRRLRVYYSSRPVFMNRTQEAVTPFERAWMQVQPHIHHRTESGNVEISTGPASGFFDESIGLPYEMPPMTPTEAMQSIQDVVERFNNLEPNEMISTRDLAVGLRIPERLLSMDFNNHSGTLTVSVQVPNPISEVNLTLDLGGELESNEERSE